jgi:hypothetical protein
MYIKVPRMASPNINYQMYVNQMENDLFVANGKKIKNLHMM